MFASADILVAYIDCAGLHATSVHPGVILTKIGCAARHVGQQMIRRVAGALGMLKRVLPP